MKLFFTVLTAITVVSTPVKAGNSIRDHQNLFDAIERVGVPVIINSEWCKPGIAGAYRWNADTAESDMHICQTHGTPGGPPVGWTDDDLDTLRHEAHHLVQDCLDGVRADNKISAVLEGPQLNAIKHVLSPSKFNAILQAYGGQGLDKEGIFAELEAFAVADAMDASQIAEHVLQACLIK